MVQKMEGDAVPLTLQTSYARKNTLVSRLSNLRKDNNKQEKKRPLLELRGKSLGSQFQLWKREKKDREEFDGGDHTAGKRVPSFFLILLPSIRSSLATVAHRERERETDRRGERGIRILEIGV